MTNGEKIMQSFPNAKVCKTNDGEVGLRPQGENWIIWFNGCWWNAEYKEPITENCIACKYDETEEEDGEHCKKCLTGDNQFELDKEFVDSTTKNNLGVSSELEKNSKKLEKNFGELDCISRKSVITIIQNHWWNCRDIDKLVNELPTVTPIRPKGHWIKIGDRGFGWSDTVICKCSECDYRKEFMGKFDGQNLIVDTERADNYCSNCGAKMESED